MTMRIVRVRQAKGPFELAAYAPWTRPTRSSRPPKATSGWWAGRLVSGSCSKPSGR